MSFKLTSHCGLRMILVYPNSREATSHIGCGVSFESLSWWACFYGSAKTYADWVWYSSKVGELWIVEGVLEWFDLPSIQINHFKSSRKSKQKIIASVTRPVIFWTEGTHNRVACCHRTKHTENNKRPSYNAKSSVLYHLILCSAIKPYGTRLDTPTTVD